MSVISETPSFRLIAIAGALFCTVAGCVGLPMVRCPLPDAELTNKILAIAPVGTPRDETIRRLKAAGLEGAFGSDKSSLGKDYYCCQCWRQPHGERWRVSLLLHFDKEGKFCETLDLPDLNPDRSKHARSAS